MQHIARVSSRPSTSIGSSMWARALQAARTSGFAKSAGILTVTMGFGDYMCQGIERHFGLTEATETDVKRVVAFAATGAFANAPLAYGGLKLGEFVCPGSSFATLLRKVTLIAVVVEPFRMSSILGANQLFLGNGLDAAAEKIRSKLPTAWTMAAVFYPPVLIGINRMPVENRMFVLGPAGVCFNTVIAYLAAQRKSSQSGQQPSAAQCTARAPG